MLSKVYTSMNIDMYTIRRFIRSKDDNLILRQSFFFLLIFSMLFLNSVRCMFAKFTRKYSKTNSNRHFISSRFLLGRKKKVPSQITRKTFVMFTSSNINNICVPFSQTPYKLSKILFAEILNICTQNHQQHHFFFFFG